MLQAKDLVTDQADFIIINKPIGLGMHSHSGISGDPQNPQNIETLNGIVHLAQKAYACPKLYLVHRLDTPTSGCLLLAKNQAAAAELSKAFAEQRVEKYYLALTGNTAKKKQGKIQGDMLKSRNGSYMLGKTLHKPACTQFFSFAYQTGVRLFIVKPKTGKTHQIRVALKANGAAIIGDARYKGASSDRLYLHSYAMGFSYQGKDYRYHALPNSGELFSSDALEGFMHEHGEPWQQQWPKA